MMAPPVKGRHMALFRSRDETMLTSLTRGVRLTLPADPGPDRMLDACQQYSPSAKPHRRNPGTIYADGNHFCLHSPVAISPEMAAQAGLPADITCAFFTDWDGAEWGLKTQDRKRVSQQYVDKSRYLLGGLAARFGGLWYPHPEELTQPLRAYVYTVCVVDAAGLLGLASRYAPELTPGDPRADNVITLHGGGALSRVQYWPPFPAVVPKSALVLGPGAPAVLDPSWPDDDTAVITIEAEQMAGQADPGVARAVGTMGLGLAAETGGVCVDIFGFKVRDPADLLIRADPDQPR
jgi:hypothetical protein